MTCDERLEQLLNRAGQTISDLPKEYKGDDVRVTVELKYLGDERNNLIQHILHLTDIIDRMEWALENVCGERDYLRKVIEKEVPCLICVTKERRADDEPCNSCLMPDGETMVNYEYAGVPEDWSADDE